MSKELNAFLENYEKAANSRNFNEVGPFIADNAVFIFTDGKFIGKPAIRRAFESTWDKIRDETYKITDVRWISKTKSVAVCVYTFSSTGYVNNQRQTYSGLGTNVLHRLDGKWQIAHEHLSKAT